MQAAHGREDGLSTIARRFADYTSLRVKQRVPWWEMVLNWEVPNVYVVLGNGLTAFDVEEQVEGWAERLRRMFLGPARPFTAYVTDRRRDSLAMRLHRPWRWFFPRLDVHDADDAPVAYIESKWAWLQRRYEVGDARGHVVGEIIGPWWRPWTFELHARGRVVGMIQKKWGGFAKELLTDADNFEITFAPDADVRWRALALAAAVLIDVMHFERAKR